jgi:spore germination cell wall hydrolase CwlJ-like protein
MRDTEMDSRTAFGAVCPLPKRPGGEGLRTIKTHLRTALAGLATTLLLAAPGAAADVNKMTRNAPAPAPRSASVNCLAEAIYFEAGGTSPKGQAAVAHVILNRAESSEFPGSVCGVVQDGCQFSYRCDGKSDALSIEPRREKALATAKSVLAGAPDITNGALFFHSAKAKAGWFKSRPRVGQIGGNVFYR